MTLNCGAQACIASLELYFGSQHLSSIQEYGALFSLVQDFTTDLNSLRSSGTVRGIADFSPAGVASADKITNAYYSRAGATIPANSSLTVALPLMCPIGTLGMKAIALSQLQDSIRLEVKWVSQVEWGTYDSAAASTTGCTISNIKLHLSEVRMDGAVERAMMDMLGGMVTMPTFDFSHFRSTVSASSGFISMQIPIRVSSACNIFIILRESLVATPHNRKQVSQRTKAGMIDYRFRLGSMVIPQSPIACTGSAAEAQFKLACTFGGGISDAAAHS
ncbi:hypothetical protein T492DRAFT_848798, partial [Pavlovales sp. CCMP2436]